MEIPLDEVVYVDVVTSAPTTGAAADADSTPTFAVYEENTDTDIGVGGNFTKRTSLTGNYRATFTCSAANGFELGKWYSVIASATVGGIAGKEVVKNFRCVAAELVAGYRLNDLGKWLGGTIPAVSVTGVPLVDAKYLLGTVFATPATAGIPEVNLKNINNQAASAAAGVTFPSSIASPTNITAGTITTATNVTNVNDKTGYSLSAAGVQAIWDALSSALTTVGSIGKRLADYITGDAFTRIGSAGAGLTALGDTRIANLDATISSRTKPADTQARVTLVDTLTTYTGNTPQTGDNYARTGTPASASIAADIAATKALLPTALVGGRMNASVGAMATDVLTAAALASDAVAEIQAGLSTLDAAAIRTAVGLASANLAALLAALQADTDDLQTRVPAALVGGRMDSSTGAMATDVLTAAALATDAVTEIQSGLSTLNAANVRTAVGLASANLDTQLSNLQSDTDDIQSRLPAALVGGRMSSQVGAMGADVLTASALASDAVTEIQSGLATGSIPTAAAIRSEIDTNSTKLAAIKTKTDNLPASPAATGDIPTAAQNAAGVLDLTDGVETSYTLRQAMRLLLAANAGKISGAGTTTITIRNAGDSKNRITATVDTPGNRTALTYDLT